MKTVKISGIDYPLDELTESQRLIASHIADLQRKITSAQWSVDQMTVGLNAFTQMFNKTLEMQ